MSKKLSSASCANCFASNLSLSACGRCELVLYCSRECQRQHWKNGHNISCVEIKSRKPTQSKKTNQAESKNSDLCCICIEPVRRQERHMPCPHSFHSECINKWLEVKKCCPLCNTIFTEDDTLFIEYIRLMRKPDIVKINQLIQILKSKPQTIYALSMLGDMYITINQISKAEEIFKLSEKKFPNNIQSYPNLARLYTIMGQRVLARKYHEKCFKLLDSLEKNIDLELVILLNYAIFLLQSPEIPEIARDFSQIVNAETFDKKLQLIENNSEYSNINPEDVEYASRLIKRALIIDPKYHKAYLVQAKLTSNQDEKISCYNLAIQYDIDRSPLSHYKIATILIATDYKKADIYYKLAIKLNKDLIEERISYFLLLSKCGYIIQGKQIIIEIIKDFPTNEKAQNLLKIFNSSVYPMFVNAST